MMETAPLTMTWQPIKTTDALKQAKEFLAASGLPYEDLEVKTALILGGFDQAEWVATAALEPHGDDWLLRSVAVVRRLRGRGIGKAGVRQLLEGPEVRSGKGVYLLTETARDFFVQLGFQEIPRSQVPEAIAKSREFSTVCPQSAVLMKYSLWP